MADMVWRWFVDGSTVAAAIRHTDKAAEIRIFVFIKG
jgi:hypothetical protein